MVKPFTKVFSTYWQVVLVSVGAAVKYCIKNHNLSRIDQGKTPRRHTFYRGEENLSIWGINSFQTSISEIKVILKE